MRKLIFVLSFVLSITAYGKEKNHETFAIAFYNLENLFDTIHDTGKNDYEYLPDGKMEWNSEKYLAKLKNMSEVISRLATDKLATGPAIIGLSEIENRRVLEDLLKQPALVSRGYEIIHYEGPDKRGIDCAFLYNPRLLRVSATKLAPYVYRDDTIHKTRGFLIASGELAGEKIHFIVNHWPSRGADSPAREWAGEQVKALKDSLLDVSPGSKVVIMGDMNDDPMDRSMSVSLGAKRKPKEVGKRDLYNPWWDVLADNGTGTLKYKGKWNLFDQIVFTGNLLGNNRKKLKYYKGEVFMRDYLFQQDGKYKGYPKRTHAGGAWLDGFSDHLPVILYLTKEVK